ncbi:MAG: glycosyltransferase [Vicinamibacterales bacterium]
MANLRSSSRLLYVGDIPVETTHHSSIQLYRLFEHYPPDCLQIIESGKPSEKQRRLPGVRYAWFPLARRRWLHSRVDGAYSVWLALTVAARAGGARRLIGDPPPDAIVTIGYGYGWLVAAELALRLGIPLHFIAHDDWPKLKGGNRFFKEWLRRRFGEVYRRAHSRLCISPLMAEEFARRYGVGGSVLYPCRADACPTFDPQPPRAIASSEAIVVGYCGGSGQEVMTGLKDLAAALSGANARVVVFGPFDEFKRRQLLAISPAFEFRGFVPYLEMIAGLRAADVLIVPMSFDELFRDNMIVSFPSKLVDYTAVGVPLLIQGPPYCSAVTWAKRNEPLAELVETPGPGSLADALQRLKADPVRRRRLAERALTAGAAFTPASAREGFEAALLSRGL